jgi:hypothetical protein
LKASTVIKLTDKKFTVIDGGCMEEMQQKDEKTQNKLVLPVRLSDEKEHLWIPNTTSQNKLRKAWGDDTEEWTDKIAEFEVAKMSVRGDMLDVIFVK